MAAHAGLSKAQKLLDVGRVDASKKVLRILLQRGEFIAECEYLLGLCDVSENNTAGAIYHCEKAALRSNKIIHRKKLADLLFLDGQLSSSEREYLSILNDQPNNLTVLRSLLQLTLQQSKRSEALQYTRKIYQNGDRNPYDEQLQVDVLSLLNPSEMRIVGDDVLCEILSLKHVNFRKLMGPLSAFFEDRFSNIPEGSTDYLQKVAMDHLFCKTLSHVLFVLPALERVCSDLRRQLLLYIAEHQSLSDELAPLCMALALQMQRNEYVFLDNEEELNIIAMFTQLFTAHVSQPDWHPKDSELVLLCLALYTPLDDLQHHGKFLSYELKDWPKSLTALVKNALYDKEVEKEFASNMPQLTEVEGDVSSEVRRQYEENPYPRWDSYGVATAMNMYQALTQWAPGVTIPDRFKSEVVRVLVAGCGTGLQPVSWSLSVTNCHITAVDLSSASLSFAKRKCNELGIDNIDFYQGDILKLGELNQQFDVISCCGVLHHMDSPIVGWGILRDLLVADGLLNIALYSRYARKDIQVQRETIEKLNLQPTIRNIKNFRVSLLSRGADYSFFKFPDFWSLSECRDLLFHVKEHQFTWECIEQYCDDLGMTFLSVNVSESVTEAFVKLYGESALSNTQAWNAFEQRNPEVFGGMYNFWCKL